MVVVAVVVVVGVAVVIIAAAAICCCSGCSVVNASDAFDPVDMCCIPLQHGWAVERPIAQLEHEGRVGVDRRSMPLAIAERFIQRKSHLVDNPRDGKRAASTNTLHAVDEYFASLSMGVLNESKCGVNVFDHVLGTVVTHVERQVLQVPLVVGWALRSNTVDDMGDPKSGQFGSILGNRGRSNKDTIAYLRAHCRVGGQCVWPAGHWRGDTFLLLNGSTIQE